jgi:superfamily I DNA/RNA helicase/RecB family exonuclease
MPAPASAPLDAPTPALDDAQRRVVELAADTSGVVVGAPGTGKTTALIARVRRLIDAGLDADVVRVLTPSRQTATALRDRLGLAVDAATSGAMAQSVAALAFAVIRSAHVRAGGEPPRLLTGGDEDRIIQDLLDGDALDEASGLSRWPDWLGAQIRATTGFRSEMRAFLAECITLGIEPSRLDALGDDLDIEAWRSCASFFAEYLQVRAQMRGAHRDAAGLVREAAALVRTADAAELGPLARVKAIMVDDAQELTAGGVDLLDACRARGIAVLAFGDPDVAAGAFRGATPENFARLSALLGQAHVLAEPHRGSAANVDLVRAVTAHIGTAAGVAHRRPPHPPASEHAPDGTVRAMLLRSAAEQYDVVARLLRERHVRDHVDWARCAVITHDTRQVAAFEAELSAREVPARSPGSGLALGTLRPVRDLLRVVELAAVDAADWTPDLLIDVLQGVIGGLDPVQLRRLRTALRHEELRSGGERTAAQLLTDACRHPTEFDAVDTREARRAARVARMVDDARTALVQGATAHELLWIVWHASGLESVWGQAARGTGPLADQANRDLDAVVALFQAAKRFEERQDATAGTAMQFVRGILHSDVAEDRFESPAGAAVSVLTPAGALGREFDTVVVAGVQDGVWPNTRLRGSLLDTWRLADAVTRAEGDTGVPDVLDRRRAAMHDELRLFVRALSRAREQVVVTAVDDDDNGPSAFFEFLPDPVPAAALAAHPLTLRGLVAAHRRSVTSRAPSGTASAAAAARAAHAAGQLALLADARVAGADPQEWYGVADPTSTGPLRDLSREDVRVSPSRLDALETCQLNWVIGDLGGDPGGTTAGLGTIIHAALEHTAGSDEAALWEQVRSRWDELEFEAAWIERATQSQARDLVHRLHLYLSRFEAAGGTLIDAEPHFEIPIPVDPVDDDAGHGGAAVGKAAHGAVLSGYIDRVELHADGKVVIVDLKTGKSEPQTDPKVAENPQLAAYQLAFESGAIPGADGHASGGAKLLVLRPSAKGKDYAEPRQPPFDDDARERFVVRVRAAVDVMRGTRFSAPFEEHCRDEHTYGLCRIHTIGPVSAS